MLPDEDDGEGLGELALCTDVGSRFIRQISCSVCLKASWF